jgi:hypothetical protein
MLLDGRGLPHCTAYLEVGKLVTMTPDVPSSKHDFIDAAAFRTSEQSNTEKYCNRPPKDFLK